MTINHERLRQFADAATPGPWSVQQWKGSRVAAVVSEHPDPAGSFIAETHTNDAAFIAACSPDVVIQLLNMLATVTASRDEWQMIAAGYGSLRALAAIELFHKGEP